MSDTPPDPQARLEQLVEGYEKDMRARPPVDEVDAPVEVEAGLPAGTNRLAAQDPTVAQMGHTADAHPAPLESLRTWWERGERAHLDLNDGRHWDIFTRTMGGGPWMTLLHGFPTSSWDWAPVSERLGREHSLLLFDLLGFGNSDKPKGHDWSAFEQADITEALWRRNGIERTRLVAHDVGLTVALELLARQEEGRLRTAITDLVLLNGGVYAGFHRPRPIQVLLQKPVIGFVVARLLSESRFKPALAEVFAEAHQPSAEDLHQHWESVAERGGSRNYHRLIRYIPERRREAARWEGALEKTQTPIRFIWGMADPVSGAHMAEQIRKRLPGADLVELPDVGHYPQLEAPERVAAEILRPVPGRSPLPRQGGTA